MFLCWDSVLLLGVAPFVAGRWRKERNGWAVVIEN